MNRRAHAAVVGLRAEASRLSGPVGILPSPFDPSPDDHLSQAMSTQDKPDIELDYDWATFINAYALGRWDPLRTPHPPRSHLQAPSHPRVSRPDSTSSLLDDDAIFDSPDLESMPDWLPPDSSLASPYLDHTSQPSPSLSYRGTPVHERPFVASSAPRANFQLPEFEPSKFDRKLASPLNLGPFPHRLRNSFADMRSHTPTTPDHTRHSSIPSTDATTTAAAIRWAAARVSVAPLALPSPEHELTDPMRGVTATIPGSHPADQFELNRPDSMPNSPTGVRKTRLSSFWQGTQDIDDCKEYLSKEHLPTIRASSEEDCSDASPEDSKAASIPFAGSSLPPATAPVKQSVDTVDDDYFGNMEPARLDHFAQLHEHYKRPEHPERQISAPPFDSEPSTVPALPRRICLTRQTSAPLPTSTLYERRIRTARPASDSSVLNLAGRAAKEEQMFMELGYLTPPNPPDELERRRALYKFNIWNTGRDVNFDRIAHLVKLVFNTRIVALSLVDGTEEFFKSECTYMPSFSLFRYVLFYSFCCESAGFGTQNMPRTSSFDAHAILQRDDEPTVILDAQEDWRFAKNPLVTGHPHIRFYVGCPLRTQDGFNIGTLTLIDDTPRQEFNPRQRHTLKEFAQIAMRELELWRDKIQLRIRDRIQSSMEHFTRECLEVDKEAEGDPSKGLFVGTSMEQVYERAARLVMRTLDVEGAIVLDVSHVDVLETTSTESSMSITMHNADPQAGTTVKSLTRDGYMRLAEYFAKHPEGRICEGIVPAALRDFLPTHIQYALTVPIFNIDKRPFALLCAYSTGERTTPFLEGHELSYLRAIGVIILSAVLKRRMVLADKAKSLFISNISHELRTPLHGASFLQTVQACGTSLVETVNHVLDFTKLSGNAKSGGVEHVIQLSKVDLRQLIEEATEGCWLGHRARMFTSEIGSVYSPPKQERQAVHVETVVDVGYNAGGWTFRCEKGGIRRILMNVFGNSLKFTSDGYVHVMLRQLPPAPDTPPNKVRIELSVIDTGNQDFLKNPSKQVRSWLAIVNSIVRSSSVDGKVDVWSYEQLKRPTISLLGFSDHHRGVQLLRTVVSSYLVSRWGFEIADAPDSGDIIVVNEELSPVMHAIENKDASRPFIIFSSARGDPRLMDVVGDYERVGGFCRIIYKPVGPCRLYAALKLCLHILNMAQRPRTTPRPVQQHTDSLPLSAAAPGSFSSDSGDGSYYLTVARRYSEETGAQDAACPHPLTGWSHMGSASEQDEPEPEPPDSRVLSQSPGSPTISVGTGGTLLKSSVGTVETLRKLRVLVIEDNSILRSLLVKWLRNKGYDYREAVDGLEGVRIFEADGRFDIVLVDLSMPVLDGIGATSQMRTIECARNQEEDALAGKLNPAARILALTGMSSLDDKRRAFEAGVDGYLVKPVAFKTLDTMFHKLGISP
ncbi:hypothetical protein B0H21DRAFT_753848 [Amylocystis lapponica]|nr:hypothetical protein B0H21DRAFT_753848 [Amylocystis lapponica]